MKTIELFCGAKSFSKVAEGLGHETFTIDNDPQFEPDLCCSVLSLNNEGRSMVGDFDVLWASPPCDGFSVASIGANWTGGHRAYIPKSDTAHRSIALAKKTIKIIEESKPKYWFIENPQGLLRKMPFMDEFLKRKGGVEHTIWYCKYGDIRAKPTNIWTNAPWTPRPKCKNYKYDKTTGEVIDKHCHHEQARRGAKTGTQGIGTYKDRSRIPADLFKEIFSHLDELIEKPI